MQTWKLECCSKEKEEDKKKYNILLCGIGISSYIMTQTIYKTDRNKYTLERVIKIINIIIGVQMFKKIKMAKVG